MVCKKCGKLIAENSAYCMFCHAPTLAAGGDFNIELDVLEDEELFTVLKKEEKNNQEPEAITSMSFTASLPNTPPKKTKVIISLVTIMSAFAVGIFSFAYTQSYGYTISRANKLYMGGDYESSYQMYVKALEKQPDGVDALIGIGNCYTQMGNFEQAKSELSKALKIQPENTKAYSSLLEVYVKTEDTEGLKEAEKMATTEKMTEALKDTVVEIPLFSVPGGKYDEDVVLQLQSADGLAIYYTIDGADPTQGKGQLYEGEIVLKEGKTTVKAACYKNESFSLISEQSYEIEYGKPSLPKVSPMSGVFDELTQITITSETEGGVIYYTWDGTTPTTASSKYTGPIAVIPGNNVLSCIVINKHGKQSEVLKCNYTYTIPEEEQNMETPESAAPEDEYQEGEEASDTEETPGTGTTGQDALEEDIL